MSTAPQGFPRFRVTGFRPMEQGRPRDSEGIRVTSSGFWPVAVVAVALMAVTVDPSAGAEELASGETGLTEITEIPAEGPGKGLGNRALASRIAREKRRDVDGGDFCRGNHINSPLDQPSGHSVSSTIRS